MKKLRLDMISKNKSNFLLVALFLAILLIGCASTGVNTKEETIENEAVGDQAGSAEKIDNIKISEFILGIGDTVEISVYRQSDIQRTVRIDHSGIVMLPLIGDVQAAGKSIFKLRDEIKDRLSKYLVDPQVFVNVTTIQSQKIMVLGEVNNPGINGVNVRESHTTAANKMTSVWDKQQFVELDQSSGTGCGKLWYKIYLPDGYSSLTGWVCGDYLTVSNVGTAPTVTTGSVSNKTSNSATLNGTVNANGLSTTAWFEYDTLSGSYGSKSATQSVSGSTDTAVSIGVSGLSSGKTYYYRLVAQNSAGITYGSEKSFITVDTTAPTGSTSINNGAAYTDTKSVTLNLSATDDVGVVGYFLSADTDVLAFWYAVSSTTNYSADVPYTLSSGDGNRTIYVWYEDAAGNQASTTSDSIILDTTAPVITITSPTSNATYTTSSNMISLGGSASDSTSGVLNVTWSNDRGGSGMASVVSRK